MPIEIQKKVIYNYFNNAYYGVQMNELKVKNNKKTQKKKKHV